MNIKFNIRHFLPSYYYFMIAEAMVNVYSASISLN